MSVVNGLQHITVDYFQIAALPMDFFFIPPTPCAYYTFIEFLNQFIQGNDSITRLSVERLLLFDEQVPAV